MMAVMKWTVVRRCLAIVFLLMLAVALHAQLPPVPAWTIEEALQSVKIDQRTFLIKITAKNGVPRYIDGLTGIPRPDARPADAHWGWLDPAIGGVPYNSN